MPVILLSEITVDIDISPTFGPAPLTVTIIVNEVNIPDAELDPFAMAHHGGFDETTQGFDSFQASHFGFFLQGLDVVYLWKFGDGQQFVGLEPGGHTYTVPGFYLLTLCIIINGEEFPFVTEITVEGVRGSTEGIGQDAANRKSLAYGNDENQGYNWSKNTGDGHLWPDTKGSIMSIFNEDLDHEQIIYDSRTGLPFIFDTRKVNSSAKILEVFKDKVNPLVEGSGTEITTRVRLQEYIASHETYFIRMSDINLFFEPMYRIRQGIPGYTEKGLRDAFAVDLELYVDEKLDKVAHADDVPIYRELFFDRQIQGHVLQIAFETASSEYRLTKTEVYILPYDKAVYPSQPEMKEKTNQEAVSDLTRWYSRAEILNKDLIDPGDVFNDNVPFTAITGADGYGQSGMELSDDTFEIREVNTDAVSLWSDLATNPFKNATLTPTIFDSFVRGSTTWYLWVDNAVGGNANDFLLPGKYFDIRGHKSALTNDQIQYVFDDVSENRGDAICPVWS